MPGKGLDLSVTQVVGGALAAMTAAALGSRLSVAGTVIGAALASIIAAVGGALYTASLRHTRDKVRSVWTGKAAGTPTRSKHSATMLFWAVNRVMSRSIWVTCGRSDSRDRA